MGVKSLDYPQFSQIVKMLELQRDYVERLNKIILTLCCELNQTVSSHFFQFASYFLAYTQLQAGSEGYGRAIEITQVYHSTLKETLLDRFMVTGAEQLELAIEHLESELGEPSGAGRNELAMLDRHLLVLEELQLKIMELLETAVLNEQQNVYLH